MMVPPMGKQNVLTFITVLTNLKEMIRNISSYLVIVSFIVLPNIAVADGRGISFIEKNSEGSKRIALIIGNSHYQHTGRLANPANDARLLASTLKEVGFEIYGGGAIVDLSRDKLLEILESFGDSLGKGDIALFFYAGHGMQVKGENFLVPVDANIKSESEVRYKAVEAGLLLAKMEAARNPLNMVILDACRNNPFARSVRSAGSGLAAVNAPAGTLVAYSTAPGTVAEDGNGDNSAYTTALAKAIKKPGLKVEEVFKEVRRAVLAATGGKQNPWENTSLVGNFVFVENATFNVPLTVVQQRDDSDREAYEIIKNSSDILDFKDFLEKFPSSPYAKTARIKLRQLEKEGAKVKIDTEARSELVRLEREKEEANRRMREDDERARQAEAAAYKARTTTTRLMPAPSTKVTETKPQTNLILEANDRSQVDTSSKKLRKSGEVAEQNRLIWTDQQSGLMWAKNANLAGKKMKWNDAMEWVKQLNYGGYSDWRMPTKNELASFAKQGDRWFKAIGFHNLQYTNYWTSSTIAGDTDKAWFVSLGNGFSSVRNDFYKSQNLGVWPVRAGK